MSISDHGPVRASHTRPTRDERLMLASDAELSQMVLKALDDRDFDAIPEIIAEKRSIERALEPSRWETFNHRMDREFFGGGS